MQTFRSKTLDVIKEQNDATSNRDSLRVGRTTLHIREVETFDAGANREQANKHCNIIHLQQTGVQVRLCNFKLTLT